MNSGMNEEPARNEGETDAAYAQRLDIWNHGPAIREFHRRRLTAVARGVFSEDVFQKCVGLGCFSR